LLFRPETVARSAAYAWADDELDFAAGPGEQAHGLLGSITAG